MTNDRREVLESQRAILVDDIARLTQTLAAKREQLRTVETDLSEPKVKHGVVTIAPCHASSYKMCVVADDGVTHWLSVAEWTWDGIPNEGERVTMTYRSGVSYGLWFVERA